MACSLAFPFMRVAKLAGRWVSVGQAISGPCFRLMPIYFLGVHGNGLSWTRVQCVYEKWGREEGGWLTRHSIMAKERVKEEDDEMREV